MPASNIVLYITAEIALALLLICVFLILHTGNLKKLIRKLEEKVVSLREAVSRARKEAKDAQAKLAEQSKIKPKSFLDFLDDEIEHTREFHQSLNPDRDIVLDITPDTPIERQASSLRHAFLIAEKEARYAGDDDTSNWDVLQGKFQQIIQFYESMAPPAPEPPEEPQEPEVEDEDQLETAADDHAEEIENYKKRIENLERFKKLFFEMEQQWEEAKAQAEEYHRQLLEMGKDLGAGDEFENMLEKYSKSFDEIEGMIAAGVDGKRGDTGGTVTETVEVDERRQPSVGKMVIANREEIQRLRNMAVDQHKVITELKRQLYEAKGAEDQQQAIEALMTQLEKQERFLKEAETCTKLIEDELSHAMRENAELHKQLQEAQAGMGAEETEQLETMISDLTNESKDMLGTIAALERENQSLKELLESRGEGGGEGGGESEEQVQFLQQKLEEMQQELLNLQTQHIELEERYLELKSAK